MLLVVGDSHVSVWTGDNRIVQTIDRSNPDRLIWHIGSLTAASAARQKRQFILDEIGHYAIDEVSQVVLSFGEIDIRCHLALYQSASVWRSIEALASGLISLARDIERRYDWPVRLQAPPPSTPRQFEGQFAVKGNCKDRNIWTRYFASLLPADSLTLPYPQLLTEFDHTREECLWDGVHLDRSYLPFLEKELNRGCLP